MFLDQDFKAGDQLRVELRHDHINLVSPSTGQCIRLEPETREESLKLAIALRKTYKRLEELVASFPSAKGEA